MEMLDWTKREVEIACKKENPKRKEDEFDYGCACYESALKAFESLCGDGHSGFSIKMTQAILNRLIDGKPLTPIEDMDDIWENVTTMSEHNRNEIHYQCNRMSSLFKTIYADGSVRYDDVDLCYCANINKPWSTYTSGLVSRIMHETFPITMPYMPKEPIAVYCEDFLYDASNGDFDTVGIFYALINENGEQKRIKIERFFRKSEITEKGDYPGWVEITHDEYEKRRNNHGECRQ